MPHIEYLGMAVRVVPGTMCTTARCDKLRHSKLLWNRTLVQEALPTANCTSQEATAASVWQYMTQPTIDEQRTTERLNIPLTWREALVSLAGNLFGWPTQQRDTHMYVSLLLECYDKQWLHADSRIFRIQLTPEAYNKLHAHQTKSPVELVHDLIEVTPIPSEHIFIEHKRKDMYGDKPVTPKTMKVHLQQEEYTKLLQIAAWLHMKYSNSEISTAVNWIVENAE